MGDFDATHHAFGEREIRFSEIYRGITMPPPRALRLSFSPTSNPYRVARKDRGRIYRETGRQKMSDLQNAETRRRLLFSLSLSSLLFSLPSASSDNLSGISVRILRAIVPRARTTYIFYNPFFLSAVFHAAGSCGFYRIYPENNAV